MKTGEALISLQNEDGEPTIVDRFTILPPQSKIGTIEQFERENHIKSNWLYGKYENKLEYTKTSDIINSILTKKENEEKNTVKEKKTTKKEKNIMSKASERMLTNTASSFGRKLGNSLFKKLFK